MKVKLCLDIPVLTP